jgi:hypothetical protein
MIINEKLAKFYSKKKATKMNGKWSKKRMGLEGAFTLWC